MSQDRKTRIKGDRVIHTVKGTLNRGTVAEGPRGLTSEQAEEQRVGAKLDQRQTREAADRVRDGVTRQRGTDELSGPASTRKSPSNGGKPTI